MIELLPIALAETTELQMYFIQVATKLNKGFNFTEIYNQIRAIENVVVINVVKSEQYTRFSNEEIEALLLEIKFISTDITAKDIAKMTRSASLIPGVFKFYPMPKTLLRIRNY